MQRFILALLVLALPALALSAQPTTIVPKYVVVTEEVTQIRCRDGQAWYPVVDVQKDDILRADARSTLWYRVDYPEGAPAVVVAADGALNEEATEVTLVRRSQLRAFNSGPSSSTDPHFWNLFPPQAPLGAGTKLTYLGPIVNNAGAVVGYKVLAPDGAQGWIHSEAVRDATQEEVRALVAEQTGGEPEQTNNQEPDTTEATQGTTEENTDEPADTTEANNVPDLVQPQDTTEENTETSTPPVPEIDPDTPYTSVNDDRLDQLDAAFERVMEQDSPDAEYIALAAEYQGVADQIDLEAFPADARTKSVIEARVELLMLRVELQAQRRRVAELRARAQDAARSAQEEAEQTARETGDFGIVGVLSASVIYTGEADGLPLMYRIRTTEAGSNRTLAYVRIEGENTLDDLLGRVVGVPRSALPRLFDSSVIVVPASSVLLVQQRGMTTTEDSETDENTESSDEQVLEEALDTE